MAHEGTVNVDRSRVPDLNGNDLGSRVGRSPMIEFRAHVDDSLNVASSKLYLPLRAMLHRNGDTMINFSQTVREKAQNNAGRHRKERVLIMTDHHLYVTDAPKMAVFAPCPSGGCFSWREFTKAQTVKTEQNTECNIIFNFVNATIAIYFGSYVEQDRCGLQIMSITGAPLEIFKPEEHNEHSRHFARDGKRMALESSAAGGAASTEGGRGSANAGSGVDASNTEVGAASGGGATTHTSGSGDRAPRKKVLHGEEEERDPSASGGPAGLENMLRFILDNDKSADGNYETLYPGKASQTENETCEIACQTEVRTVDRSNSPIAIQADLRDDETESNYSDFDHGDVWKSLAGGNATHGASFMRRPAGRGAAAHPSTPSGLSRGVTFRADPNSNTGSPQGGNDGGLARVRSGPRLHGQQHGGMDDEMGTLVDTDDLFTNNTVGNNNMAPGMGLEHSHRGGSSGGSSGGGGGGAGAASFSAWLGLLSQYQAQFLTQGVDNANRLTKLTDRELEALMDTVGIHKHGHRVLLQSKIGVLKQGKAGRK